MTSEHDQPHSREQRFQEVLVKLLEVNETGQTLKPEEWRVQYPEFVEELDEFFAGKKQVNELAGAFRQAAGVAVRAGGAATAGVEGPPQSGSRLRYFGDYELLEEIARGGMGVVYRARQVSLNRIVALKMILSGHFAGDSDVKRFHREAEAAANLDHPNIVPIYEVGEHEGQHYYSMKLVEGGDLGQWIADGRLKIADFQSKQRDAARLLAVVARAVHHAHQRGILHRDLKPANILLQHPPGQSASANLQSTSPLVTDFGLARRVERDQQVTQSGSIIGTPSYMAPEQAGSRKDLSTAVDVYSLGAILYELLTGRPPFVADTALDVVLQVLHQEPARPGSLNPRIDRDLEIICLKCLKKESRERYGSTEALADDLERWLKGEPIRARASSRWERAVKWARRRPAVAALLVLGVLFTISTTIGLWMLAILLDERLQMVQQKAETDTQSRLAEQRHWQSLLGEARAERLAGNRTRALALLAEAARLNPAPEVRQEAIQTVTSPGLRLLHEIPVGFVNTVQFSGDSKILAVHGVFGAGPGIAAGDPEARIAQRLKVWRVPSMDLLGDTHLPASIGGVHVGHSFYRCDRFTEYNPFLTSPQSPLIALRGDPKADKLRLWDPGQDRTMAEVEIRPYATSIVFSPDGLRLAVPAPDPKREMVRVWDLTKGTPGNPFAGSILVAFLPDDKLVAGFWDGKDFRLQRLAVSSGTQLGTTPSGTSVLAVSDDGRLAAILKHGAKTGDPIAIWDVVADKELASIPTAVPAGYSPFGAR